MQDLYDILGIDRGADDATIKSAYRKLAKKYHPDRNPDDAEAEARFKEVSAAYEILKDPQKRSMYDTHGQAAFENGGGQGGFGGGMGGFADIFEQMFGGGFGGGSPRPQRGEDIRVNMVISLEDAYTGMEREIKVPIKQRCHTCDGQGTRDGSEPENCSQCNGRGQVQMQQGLFRLEQTCPVCRGRGQMIVDPCADCHGTGLKEVQQNVSVNIPAGIEEGQRIRMNGKGEAGPRGTRNGDLYIFIRIAEHKLFQRDGADLHCEIPISMADASLGASMEIPLPTSKRVQVKIPAGTQNGTRLRLRGKGMPILRRDQFGDLFVHARVETPVNLSERQVELMEEFRGLSESKNSPESEGFVQKLKKLFN